MTPPNITLTTERDAYEIGDTVKLLCYVFSDKVDENVLASAQWSSRGTNFLFTILPTMMSSLYTIDGGSFLQFTFNGVESEAHNCSGTLTSTNEHVLDSDTVTVSKFIRIEGKY